MISLWDFWKSEAKDYVFGQLEATQVPDELIFEPIKPDASYLKVTLRRIRIVNARIGSKTFHAAAYADLGLWHSSGHFVNFKQVIVPPELKDVAPSSLDRSILRDYVVLGPTPYRGGPLQLNFALLSVRSSDLAGPYLDVLSGLAGLAGVSYIKAADPFLKPLAQGIDLLSGIADAAIREVQVVAHLEPVMAGIFVVMRATSEEIKIDKVRVQKDWTLADVGGAPIANYPYVVFTIEGLREKYDWLGISEIKLAYERLTNAIRRDDPREYRNGLTAFRRVLQLNDDLLAEDARQLGDQVEEKLGDLLKPIKTSGGIEGKQVPSLGSFVPFLK